ncbi:MAG: hypothetical protein IBJ11_04225 [Phycisphaerales bacterium]|nr:hypothetical protein [Phycisphaerales bacterium]
MRITLGVLIAAVGLPIFGGCASDPKQGYVFATAYRTDVQTVSVPLFDNPTFYHGLEAQLADAIIKEIHRATPWRVVSRGDAGDAAAGGSPGGDTSLTGSIAAVDLRKLSTQDVTGLVQEMAVDLAVNFQWKNNRTGEVLVARRNFRASAAFVPSRGAQEPIELGQRAAVDRLAKDLVAELRSSW